MTFFFIFINRSLIRFGHDKNKNIKMLSQSFHNLLLLCNNKIELVKKSVHIIKIISIYI